MKTLAEAQALKTEAFDLVVEAAPNAMIMVGVDGSIALVNTQTEKLFGYQRHELRGQPMEMLLPERLRARHAAHRSSFFAALSARPMGAGRDLFGLRKDGSEVPVEIGLNPIATPEGLFVLASIIDITERLKATAELRQSLEEKTTLLKEIHHRVKNNLQVVCSLLSMQIECAAAGPAVGPLNDAHSRILAMSLIHEQIYGSETLADLNFGDYVNTLSDQLFRAYCVDPSRIRLEVSVEPIQLTIDHAIPCGLILNELVTNSLKHAFRDGREGVIRISLRTDEEGHIEIEVADNGVGMPAGFRLEDSHSLGLQVVRSLSGQIRATLQVSSGAASGATSNGRGTISSFKWKPLA